MAVPAPDVLLRRVEELERRTAAAEAELKAQRRAPQTQPAPAVFLVRTRADQSDEYPESDADTFAVAFLDAEFDEEPGDQDATLTPRSAAVQAIANHPGGDWLPEGRLALALRQRNGKWVIVPLPGVRLKGVTYDDISAGGSGLVTIWINGQETDVRLTGHSDTSEIAAGTRVTLEWFADEQKWTVTREAGGHVMLEGYLIGQLTKSKSSKSIEIAHVYGGGAYTVGQQIAVSNPVSRQDGGFLFEGVKNAWCKASVNDQGEARFDVVECPPEELVPVVPSQQVQMQINQAAQWQIQLYNNGTPLSPGEQAAAPGIGRQNGAGFAAMLRQLPAAGGLSPRQIRNLTAQTRTSTQRWNAQRVANWNASVQAQLNTHRQIHQGWTNYLGFMRSLGFIQ